MRWMISGVARVFEPGCQADCMLVFEGEQGLGKSTGAEALVPDVTWFADSGIELGNKDSYQSLRCKWLFEFSELASLKGREAERVKSFVSARTDYYRPSYARRARNFQRQVIFIGTTNESEYLHDPTGNRRFWPVRCVRPIDVARIRADRDQLWAEAVHLYRAGHPWHVDTAELRKLCSDEQREREPVDPWVEVVEPWLLHPTIPTPQGTTQRLDSAKGVTTTEVLLGAIGMAKDKIEHRHAVRAGRVLRALGWMPTPQQREGRARVRRYLPPSPADPSQPSQSATAATCDTDPAENPPPSLLSQLPQSDFPLVAQEAGHDNGRRDRGAHASVQSADSDCDTCDTPPAEDWSVSL
jgi:putative DNA primase/helicase